MRILYLSVHQVLEYDDLRLFRRLGHQVFSIGNYIRPDPNFPLRPSLDLGADHPDLLHAFETMGCVYDRSLAKCFVTPEFVSLFDVVVVMHDADSIARLWSALRVRPVIWRTIGQAVDHFESVAAPLRADGLHIVRYSPNEMLSDSYIGSDALIRFAKDPADFPPWEGHECRVVSFVNLFAQRYPGSYARYERLTAGLPHVLGGLHNEGLPSAVGAVAVEAQLKMLQSSRAYLYASGDGVPYTLTFMEAWLAGIPVVLMDDGEVRSRFDEIPVLVRDGETGFVARTEDDARCVLEALMRDDALARRIGNAGRQAAEAVFGWDVAAEHWGTLLEAVAATGRPS